MKVFYNQAGQGGLACCDSWGRQESDTTERLNWTERQRRRQWQPTPVLLPGGSYGRRSLVGCSPWGHWELDMTQWLHFHALEKKMATHSSVLAWRIPGTGEPGGLPSMGSHRIGHDWSNLAAAVAPRTDISWEIKPDIEHQSFILQKQLSPMWVLIWIALLSSCVIIINNLLLYNNIYAS